MRYLESGNELTEEEEGEIVSSRWNIYLCLYLVAPHTDVHHHRPIIRIEYDLL